jgi:hypothetical protein
MTKRCIALAALALALTPISAQAATCEQLKAGIALLASFLVIDG